MCPFVEKKEKNVVFSLTYNKKPHTLFFQPPPTPPIINKYHNIQLLLLFGTREYAPFGRVTVNRLKLQS